MTGDQAADICTQASSVFSCGEVVLPVQPPGWRWDRIANRAIAGILLLRRGLHV